MIDGHVNALSGANSCSICTLASIPLPDSEYTADENLPFKLDRFNFATHPYHGTDTSKYYEGGNQPESKSQ